MIGKIIQFYFLKFYTNIKNVTSKETLICIIIKPISQMYVILTTISGFDRSKIDLDIVFEIILVFIISYCISYNMWHYYLAYNKFLLNV